MKKWLCAFIAVLLMFTALSAYADTEVPLAGTGYALTLPDAFKYLAPGDEEFDRDLIAIYQNDDTEIEIFSYPVKDIRREKLLAEMKKAASDAGMTRVNGIEMLWYVTVDQADGATCVGYMLPAGDELVEIDLWVGTQKAMDAAKAIIESIHQAGGSGSGNADKAKKSGGNA